MTLLRTLSWCAGAVGAVLLWGEYEHWRASRRVLGTGPAAAGNGPAAGPRSGTGTRPSTEAVVVLGYRDAGPRANVVNRWRVRAGLRSQQPELGPTRLVVCGGTTAGPHSEAALMARYARDERGYDGDLRLETTSRTTWENIRNVVPLIADADRIKIVSHPLHAEKGRAYLHRQHPDLARRLVRGADYRFGEWMLVKPALAVYGRRRLRRLGRRQPAPRPPSAGASTAVGGAAMSSRTGDGPPARPDEKERAREAHAAPTATRGRRSRRVVGRGRLPSGVKEAAPHEPTD